MKVLAEHDATRDETVPRAASRRAILQLARVEAKRLARNPFLIIGLLLTMLVTGVGRGGFLKVDDFFVGLLVWPMAGMVLIASNMAVLRGRRDDLEEQYATMPIGPAARTLAHAIALWVPFVYACAYAALWTFSSLAFDAIGWPDPLEMLTGPVLVVAGGLVGILLARLVPRSVVTPFMVVAIGFIEGGLSSDRANLRPLAFFMPSQYQPDWVVLRPTGLHLVYLIGICAALLVGAIMRHRRSPRVAVAFALSITIAATAGLAQYGAQSPEHDAWAASWIGEPAKHQTCATHGAVTYCAYTEVAELIPRWREAVEGVLALTPAAVRARPLTLRQRLTSGEVAGITRAEIRRLLPFEVTDQFVWPVDDEVHPAFSQCWASKARSACQGMLALSIASRAVGLSFNRPQYGLIDARGQARAVIALWLMLRSTPAVLKARPAVPDNEPGMPAPPVDRFDLLPCGDDGVPVMWSYDDMAYARRLAALEPADVAARLGRTWSTWIDETKPTTDLVAAFHLEPPTELLRRTPSLDGVC